MVAIHPGILSFFISGGLAIFMGVASFVFYNKKRITSMILFGAACIMSGTVFILDALADVSEMVILRNYSMVFGGISYFLFIAFTDYNAKESLLTFKQIIFWALISVTIYVEFQPGSNVWEESEDFGVYSWHRIDPAGLLTKVVGFFVILCLLSWIIQMMRKSPKNLRKYTYILLVDFAFLFLSAITVIPLNFQYCTLMFFGVIFIVFLFDFKVLYILTFQANQLLVFTNHESINLFDKKWTAERTEPSLFSGFISAITSMGKEILKKGNIREMILDTGVLLFKPGNQVTTLLLTSKSSKALRLSLEKFSLDFENQFKKELGDFIGETTQFQAASALIEKHFAFVPSR
ncbi:MAG: hypothetical protein ACFFCS_12175 [Candidatus Hodarchaeota archaeon]